MKPNVIRSKGVKKWRRLSTGWNFGPSGGSFASDAAFAAAEISVTPLVRVVNTYAAATLSGPETLLNAKRAVPFATASIEKCSTTGFFSQRLFVHEYVPASPCLNGK